MSTDSKTLFPRLRILFVLLLLLAASVLAEEPAQRAERFDSLVEALNATSQRRTKVLENIYKELRGPDSREMQEVLRENLTRSNTLILQGVVEALAMLGNADDLAALEALLATTDKMEVKNLVLRILPAFCLQAERTRFNYISYASGYERTASPGTLEPLRRLPLTRRGRLNQNLERLQGRITRTLAEQFDPVAAALRHIDDRLYGKAAKATVQHYVGNGLGNVPERWASIWAAQGNDMDLRVPEEVREIRLSALQALSDMGAEGHPEVIGAFGRLLESDDPILMQAAFETMMVMSRTAFSEFEALADMRFEPEDEVEAENWRRRRYRSATRLALFSSGSAEKKLSRPMDPAAFAAAAACLGAAISFPKEFPDSSGALVATRIAGQDWLERLLLRPDLSRPNRSAVAAALGEVGSSRAVEVLASVLLSPYCSPDLDGEGRRMAEVILDALRTAATGFQDGRDDARAQLLAQLSSAITYPPVRVGTPDVKLAHMALWRLQRLARVTDISMDAEFWRERLGW